VTIVGIIRHRHVEKQFIIADEASRSARTLG
jgi:hypothetical protein